MMGAVSRGRMGAVAGRMGLDGLVVTILRHDKAKPPPQIGLPCAALSRERGPKFSN